MEGRHDIGCGHWHSFEVNDRRGHSAVVGQWNKPEHQEGMVH